MHAFGFLATTITWDPFLRGIVIIGIFVGVLPGTVYLVLATDVGARVGFLLIAAGMTGMMCLLAILWMALDSSADIGRPNSWKPLEVISGTYKDQVTVKSAASLPVDSLPKGVQPPIKALPTKHWYWPLQSCNDNSWHKIDPTLISDPESESDAVLANSAGKALGPNLTSPFKSASDYVYVDGYRKGQNSGCLFAVSRHKVYLPLARGADIVVLRVKPALPGLNLSSAPPAAVADPNAPFTYVILERNLGSVREPQFIACVVSGILFLVICYVLHVREKEQEEENEGRGAGGAGPGGAGPGGGGPGGGGTGGSGSAPREPVGAGV